jgi:hypothetical protein
MTMVSKQSFDEVRVYEGVAERTGAHFKQNAVRRSAGCCRSVSELMRKVRASGDGVFYLPLDIWPADAERVDLRKQWVVLSSLPLASRVLKRSEPLGESRK